MSLYFIQPCLIIGTNRYKIGMSKTNDLTRVKSYHKGTRYIFLCECINAKEVESILIKEFKKKYKLIAGNEYYEIKDENEALELFIEIFLKYRKKIEIKQEEKSYIHQAVDTVIDDLSNKFNNITSSWMDRFSHKST